MRTVIVYASVHHGNTRRLAEALAQTFAATLLTVEEAQALDGGSIDLVGFGSGIYFGRHHSSLLALVQNLRTVPAQCFVFSTAGISSLAALWHRSLNQRIHERGSQIVGQFCCPGWDTVGPLWLFGGLHRRRPNESDLSRAANFGRSLRAKLESECGRV